MTMTVQKTDKQRIEDLENAMMNLKRQVDNISNNAGGDFGRISSSLGVLARAVTAPNIGVLSVPDQKALQDMTKL